MCFGLPSAVDICLMVAVQRWNSPDRPLMSRSASLALAAVLSACAIALFLSSVACGQAHDPSSQAQARKTRWELDRPAQYFECCSFPAETSGVPWLQPGSPELRRTTLGGLTELFSMTPYAVLFSTSMLRSGACCQEMHDSLIWQRSLSMHAYMGMGHLHEGLFKQSDAVPQLLDARPDRRQLLGGLAQLPVGFCQRRPLRRHHLNRHAASGPDLQIIFW